METQLEGYGTTKDQSSARQLASRQLSSYQNQDQEELCWFPARKGDGKASSISPNGMYSLRRRQDTS